MSSVPMAAKRRQFERHKCDQSSVISINGQAEEDDEADDEAESRAPQIRTLNNRLANGNSLVTSKIGLFERLSYEADSYCMGQPGPIVKGQLVGAGRFSRQVEIDDDEDSVNQLAADEHHRHQMAAEEVLFDDEDDLDEDYLVLDTIVEEDEELAASGPGEVGETKASTTTTASIAPMRNGISCESAPSFATKVHLKNKPTSPKETTDGAKCDDRLDCDRLAKLTTPLNKHHEGINNNVRQLPLAAGPIRPVVADSVERQTADFSTNSPRPVGEFSAIGDASCANKNNGLDAAAAEIAHNMTPSATSENNHVQQQQPPAETRTSSSPTSQSSSSALQAPSSSARAFSPASCRLSPADEQAAAAEEENNKSCADRKLAARQQQVGVVRAGVVSSDERHVGERAKEPTVSMEAKPSSTGDNMTSNQHQLQGPIGDNCDSSSLTTTTTTNPLNTTTTTNTSTNNEKETLKANQQARQANFQAQANKMQYQTLLPSTNRLISEHQARQQQALFRALNERQKILDELGPDERLEQGDLMSSSCISLNLHSNATTRRQWRKSGATTAARRAVGVAPRTRSNSANASQQNISNRARKRASSKSRGVPLSSVDLSSMTDQQMDEILGQLAPASSSSSLVSSNASHLDHSSGSSSGSSSSADDFSTSSGSTDDDEDFEDQPDHQDGLALDGQKTSKSLMLRRLRRRLATDSEQRSSSLASHQFAANGRPNVQTSGGGSSQQQQQQGLAPSVIGVHEDDSMSVNSARRSLRSSARNCREAYKKRGRNGRSDDDDDENGDHERDRRNQGDLFVSVASASSRDQQTSGLGASQGSGQCSLSPLACQAQTIATGGGSATVGGGSTSHLLLASAMRNHQLANGNVGVTTSQQQLDYHSLGSSSLALSQSQSQSPTTSDEPASMGLPNHNQLGRPQAPSSQSVEAILSRMLGALDEIGAYHEEQEQLNDLLERGFLHLEQLLNCSLTPQNSNTLPRSHYQTKLNHQHHLTSPGLTQASSISSSVLHHPPQQLSQKDSDYGSDTQSNGDCFSSSTSQPGQDGPMAQLAATTTMATTTTITTTATTGLAIGTGANENKPIGASVACSPASPRSPENSERQPPVAAATTASASSSSSLSPLAIELSFRLAESLRRLAQQQQLQANRQAQPEAAMATTSVPDAAPAASAAEPATQQSSSTPPLATDGDEQPPKARMKSVVMINATSPQPQSVADERNMTPVAGGRAEDETSIASPISQCLEESAQKQQQQQPQRQQFKTRVNINAVKSQEASQQQQQPVAASETQIVKVISGGQFERVSRRSSFRNSSLRRRPSFSGSIASVNREPGAPRPGSPVPRSMLELAAQAAASNPTGSTTPISSGRPLSRQTNNMSESHLVIKSQEQQYQDDATKQEQAQQQHKQQHQLQRALILAQKYNYSPAKLATSKLSSKLYLKELIATGTNNYGADQDGDQRCSSSERPNGGDPNSARLLTATTKTLLPNGNIKFHSHEPGRDKRFQLGGDPLSTTTTTNIDVTGQVQLDISYFARTGSLTVHLLQCSQLAPMNKRRNTSNPYVKLYLLPDRTRSGKRKSSVKKRQLDPKFDERFTFGPIQLHEFDSRTLWLSVWHKDRGLSRNEFLGELYLPMSRVRQQLLTSDLCQSISSRWYQLTSPLERAETLRHNEHTNPPLRQADGTLLTTKKLPPANGLATLRHGATSGERATDTKTTTTRDPSASETEAVRKLSEFEMKAARLTQQHHLFAMKPAGDEPATKCTDSSRNTNKAPSSQQPRYRPSQSGLATGLHLNLDGPGQAPFKTMQVSLGTIPQNQTSDCSISGQLFVALKFVPESGELLAKRASAQVWGSLHVLIKEARDIGGFKSGSSGHVSDQLPSPFCKCLLLDSSGQRMAKHKTNQLRRTNSPRWDQELVFPRLKVSNLQAQAIEIQLLNRDSILVSSSEHLGSIRLCKRLKEPETGQTTGGRNDQDDTSITKATNATNMASISSSASLKSSTSSSSATTTHSADDDLCSEREARLWGQMLARPNIWVYGELPLRQLRPLVALPTITPGTNSTDNK